MSDDGSVITLFPTGHAFRAEPRETVLEAGLRAGFNLNHSCATGTCGSCRARLVAGEIALSQPHDYTFSAAERAAGWFLMCRNRAVQDLLVEAAEHATPAAIPEQRINARVARVERLQEEVVLLQVRTPRSGGLRFLAGQSASLCFEGMTPVELPIASCPCDSLHLRFHLRRRAEDPFSDFVFDRLQKGHPVALCGPRGDFTLDESSERPLLFVAWESGFARVQGLVDHALQVNPEREIHLYWLSSIPRGHYLSNYCRAWMDALDDFHYHSIDLAPHGEATPERVLEDIAGGHGSLQGWDAYLALPPELLERAGATLVTAGMPTAQLHTTVHDRA